MANTNLVRRLHVWEHPDLHENGSELRGDAPVHVVWEPDEFDWYRRDNLGDLIIGCFEYYWIDDFDEDGNPRKKRETDKVTLAIIPRGMYAKVWLELVEAPVSTTRHAGEPVAIAEPAPTWLEWPNEDSLLDLDLPEPPPMGPTPARDRFTRQLDRAKGLVSVELPDDTSAPHVPLVDDTPDPTLESERELESERDVNTEPGPESDPDPDADPEPGHPVLRVTGELPILPAMPAIAILPSVVPDIGDTKLDIKLPGLSLVATGTWTAPERPTTRRSSRLGRRR
jgi:hypothetical protein